MTLSYETLVLLLALAFLLGTLARPIRNTARAILRARRNARRAATLGTLRKRRRRRKVKTTGIY